MDLNFEHIGTSTDHKLAAFTSSMSTLSIAPTPDLTVVNTDNYFYPDAMFDPTSMFPSDIDTLVYGNLSGSVDPVHESSAGVADLTNENPLRSKESLKISKPLAADEYLMNHQLFLSIVERAVASAESATDSSDSDSRGPASSIDGFGAYIDSLGSYPSCEDGGHSPNSPKPCAAPSPASPQLSIGDPIVLTSNPVQDQLAPFYESPFNADCVLGSVGLAIDCIDAFLPSPEYHSASPYPRPGFDPTSLESYHTGPESYPTSAEPCASCASSPEPYPGNPPSCASSQEPFIRSPAPSPCFSESSLSPAAYISTPEPSVGSSVPLFFDDASSTEDQLFIFPPDDDSPTTDLHYTQQHYLAPSGVSSAMDDSVLGKVFLAAGSTMPSCLLRSSSSSFSSGRHWHRGSSHIFAARTVPVHICSPRNFQLTRPLDPADFQLMPFAGPDARGHYRCPVPRCKYVQRRKRRSDMIRHLQTHRAKANQERWVCCGVRVEDAVAWGIEDLREAYWWKGRWMVGGCLRGFSRRDALARHILRASNGCKGHTDIVDELNWQTEREAEPEDCHF